MIGTEWSWIYVYDECLRNTRILSNSIQFGITYTHIISVKSKALCLITVKTETWKNSVCTDFIGICRLLFYTCPTFARYCNHLKQETFKPKPFSIAAKRSSRDSYRTGFGQDREPHVQERARHAILDDGHQGIYAVVPPSSDIQQGSSF